MQSLWRAAHMLDEQIYYHRESQLQSMKPAQRGGVSDLDTFWKSCYRSVHYVVASIFLNNKAAPKRAHALAHVSLLNPFQPQTMIV